jgi:hypothetical protein
LGKEYLMNPGRKLIEKMQGKQEYQGKGRMKPFLLQILYQLRQRGGDEKQQYGKGEQKESRGSPCTENKPFFVQRNAEHRRRNCAFFNQEGIQEYNKCGDRNAVEDEPGKRFG